MKSSATHKAVLHSSPLSATSPLSHIPLPRRKNSGKGDKGPDVDDTDSEYSNDVVATRSQAKMSLLGSTSFCCASGQKEDYIPDAKIVPTSKPPKKRPPNNSTRKESDPSTPKTPLLGSGKGLLVKNKKDKNGQENTEEVQIHSNDNGSIKFNSEDIKIRTGVHEIENRLRPVEERRKITPPSPKRRIQREPLIPRKDHPDVLKYPDAVRKHRKDSNVSVPNQCVETLASTNAKKCKHANERSQSCSGDQHQTEARNGRFMAPESHAVVERPEKYDLKLCNAETKQKELGVKEIENSDIVVDALNKSHESDDFDCPCCDRTSIAMDETGLSDVEIKMFTSCDVIAPTAETTQELTQNVRDTCDASVKTISESLHNLQSFAINVLPPTGIPHKTLSDGYIPSSGHSPFLVEIKYFAESEFSLQPQKSFLSQKEATKTLNLRKECFIATYLISPIGIKIFKHTVYF
ncbi:uncharacterized protein TNCT_182861 [Trichonephila clavata]|uniref:Uncharacterized protein n=1 Tax=Trichonephila clavata TaxID=2740835 RepID=A0A8X6KYB8_TRICU|nr:uncharacterized protein TNCT_182861 [Trichonephila clavata]